MKRVFFLLLGGLLISCSDISVNPDVSSDLYGIWVYHSINDNNIFTMVKSSGFETDKPGLSIEKEGKFIERQINGWCGTLPVTYDNYDGKWTSETTDLLNISVGYWGGILKYKMKIISLTKSTLQYQRI
jgi:hypothetical protein